MAKKKSPKKGKKKSPERKEIPLTLIPGKDDPGFPPGPHSVENHNRMIHRILEMNEFENIEEANRFLQENIVGRRYEELVEEYGLSPEDRAHELVSQAMDSRDPIKVEKLLKQVLEIDPDNVAAKMYSAHVVTESDLALTKTIGKIIKDAEKALGGKKFFKENRGHFWVMMETRPYMRAKQELAELLKELGRHKQAIQHYEQMLDLNPNDNQGVRDILLGLYLETEDLEGAQRLFKSYPEESSANFLYGRVLERYLAEDLAGAAKVYKKAVEANPHFKKFLLGKKRMPKEMPQYFSPGDVDEAVLCVCNLGFAWTKYPDAVEWLESMK